MLAYHRDESRSRMAYELLRGTERGLTAIAAAFPELHIAGGYYHYVDAPLAMLPTVFLLDIEEKRVVDAIHGNDSRIISYYVAGTLDKGGKEKLMVSIQATGERLSQEGFHILDKPENLKLLV